MEVYFEKMMEQLNSGESKTIFRNISYIVIIGLTTSGKNMARGGGNKKGYQYCTDSSGAILYHRALQGHSGRSLIDPTSQDNVINSERFLRVHVSHRMCNQFTLHHEFRIDTERTKFGQGKTDVILYGCEFYEQGTQRSVRD